VGLFDRFPPPGQPPQTPDDPVFGEIEPTDDGGWEAYTLFEPVEDDISVVGPDAEPTEAQRHLFLQLKERYPALSKTIARCLFKLYRPHLATADEAGRPKPKSPDEMLTLTGLNWIEFGSAGEMRLGYGFRDDDDVLGPVFTIRILGWQPTGESVDMSDESTTDD
jgi:hypothetical protein